MKETGDQTHGKGIAVARRAFLRSTVGGIAAGTLAASGLAHTALAQDWKTEPGSDRNKGRRILLRGGTILSMDPAVGDFLKGDVLIDGTRITRVDKSISSRGATVVDATGTIIVPGFVDTHRHAWQNHFRRAIPNSALASRLLGLHAFGNRSVLPSAGSLRGQPDHRSRRHLRRHHVDARLLAQHAQWRPRRQCDPGAFR